LQQNPPLEVCGEAHDGGKAVAEAQRLKPDVVLLNVTTSVLNGVEAAREIRKSLPESKIAILSSSADRRFVEEANEDRRSSLRRQDKSRRGAGKSSRSTVKGEDFYVVE